MPDSIHRSPHNVIAMRIRRADASIEYGWSHQTVPDRIENIANVVVFAGAVAVKLFQLSVVSVHELFNKEQAGT